MTRLGRGRQYPGQTRDARGRVRVQLGKAHPYATANGSTYRSRLVVAEHLGRRLEPTEHVDHRGALDDDRLAMLRHFEDGREHNRRHALKRRRDARGRFVR